MRNATLSKERLWHRYFPVSIIKFFKNTFLYRKISRRLLLHFCLNCFQSFGVFLVRFWSSIKKCFFHSLWGYFERIYFFICWFLIHWVIIAILFLTIYLLWELGLTFKLIFKTTCLLWVKKERTVFSVLLFFHLYCLLCPRFKSRVTIFFAA